MGIVQDSIGLRWENVLRETYPELEATRRGSDLPDFHHPNGFWVEAKAGNANWGGRVKSYQFKQISRLEEPIVYAFGMHDLNEAMKRVTQKNESARQRYLERNLRFVEIYFVSGELVHKIFEREKRVSKKRALEYCMIKPSILRNVLQDREFNRFGKRIESSEEYYDFDRSKYLMKFEGNTGVMLSKEVGAIVRTAFSN